MSNASPVRKAYDATWGRAFAAIYDITLAGAEKAELGRRRAEVVGQAEGKVLELGAGTGLNLEHYGPGVTELTLTEPFGPMAKRLRARVDELRPGTSVIETPAEQLPFGDDSFDTVVSTLVLCTVEDQPRALAEIRRVLKPGGKLLFLEHVRANSPGLAKWQDRLHGPWFVFGHGCHCNRDTLSGMRTAGFDVDDVIESEWAKMPPLVKPIIRGAASS